MEYIANRILAGNVETVKQNIASIGTELNHTLRYLTFHKKSTKTPPPNEDIFSRNIVKKHINNTDFQCLR